MTQSGAHLTREEATTSYDTSGTIWIFQQRCGGSSEIQGLVHTEYIIPLVDAYMRHNRWTSTSDTD